MKYLLISDIHGSLPALKEALKLFDSQHCDMICIMGDILNYGPRNEIPEGIDPKGIAECLNSMADKIIAVRGNCDSEVDQMLLDFPIMSDYAMIVDEGHKLFLTHGHIYNKENLPKGNFDAIIYGHTHLWELCKISSTTICNTGSVTFPKGGNPPTLAIYENGTIKIFHLNGKLIKQFAI
ncbi:MULTISPECIES: phosphodiesterase [Prevotella]|uniref:Phosphoesterase n=1 Tax=Prevotella herbatica TaxID=2801997 RepID=A0ABN6EEI6_9BACT|nr:MULTISPECIES: phosphodiesterase [Prevotella]MDN5554959.1 phosphodiesterase [Prevotella sp.]BCS84345.1 phosphoesterase [Prevotella herbatica]